MGGGAGPGDHFDFLDKVERMRKLWRTPKVLKFVTTALKIVGPVLAAFGLDLLDDIPLDG